MSLRSIISKTEKVVTDNSPLILTAIGVTGTVTTAFFAGKASFKAADILREEEERRFKADMRMPGSSNRLERKETFQLLWKLYIPAAGVGAGTIACIILANRIGTRRAAAVATAYAISEKAFVEYKDKVIEKMGEKQEQNVRDEIAQSRVNATPASERTVIIAGGEGALVMCHDAYSDRYFKSSMERLRKAENDINKQIHHNDYASLTEFYNNIGIPKTSVSDEMGWNTDKWLELSFTTVMTEDDQTPCISFDFATVPIRDHWFLP